MNPCEATRSNKALSFAARELRLRSSQREANKPGSFK
jgi:hypothetical protein